MITYIPNFLSNPECEYYIDLFKSNDIEFMEWIQTYNKFGDDDVLKFYYNDLTENKFETDKFPNYIFKTLRIQMVNESIDQCKAPHTHVNPWSFVIFLNENFIGGELVFDNIEYEPKTGDMVYFSGEERHKLNNCVGDRYTLIGGMQNNPLNVKTGKLI